jgi:hypothetical protein
LQTNNAAKAQFGGKIMKADLSVSGDTGRSWSDSFAQGVNYTETSATNHATAVAVPMTFDVGKGTLEGGLYFTSPQPGGKQVWIPLQVRDGVRISLMPK